MPSARLHTRLLAAEWHLGHLADIAELVVSELVTNALRATQALTGYREHGTWRAGRPPLWLWVWSDGCRVLVQVWDAGERMPLTREPGLDDEHGRGLLLVESLSTQRGVYRLAGTSGKVVWAAMGPGDSR